MNVFEDKNCDQCGVSGKDETLTFDENGTLLCSECFFVNMVTKDNDDSEDED
jgi:hypothetical protein